MVIAGRVAAAMTSQLSKPTTATSSGTRTPDLAQRIDDAARDLVAAAEDGIDPGTRRISCCAASRPKASLQSPARTSAGPGAQSRGAQRLAIAVAALAHRLEVDSAR